MVIIFINTAVPEKPGVFIQREHIADTQLHFSVEHRIQAPVKWAYSKPRVLVALSQYRSPCRPVDQGKFLGSSPAHTKKCSYAHA